MVYLTVLMISAGVLNILQCTDGIPHSTDDITQSTEHPPYNDGIPHSTDDILQSTEHPPMY